MQMRNPMTLAAAAVTLVVIGVAAPAAMALGPGGPVGTYPNGPPPIDEQTTAFWPQERQLSRQIATQQPVQFIEGILSVHQKNPTVVNYTIEHPLVTTATSRALVCKRWGHQQRQPHRVCRRRTAALDDARRSVTILDEPGVPGARPPSVCDDPRRRSTTVRFHGRFHAPPGRFHTVERRRGLT